MRENTNSDYVIKTKLQRLHQVGTVVKERDNRMTDKFKEKYNTDIEQADIETIRKAIEDDTDDN